MIEQTNKKNQIDKQIDDNLREKNTEISRTNKKRGQTDVNQAEERTKCQKGKKTENRMEKQNQIDNLREKNTETS